ncbi:receptor-like protein 13 [Hibiscus syriacus]|uniref:receptor-like protein 13 n=1 Tax=Hibiscus syriacus TaxID=106335 RepID=UPI0019225E3A|nr:receptor-like protein 13 [Hibiscus syriacus]
MEYKWVAMLLLALLMLGVGWSEGCVEEERLVLLRLKPFFPFIDYRTKDLGLQLEYYKVEGSVFERVEEKEGSPDCCEWERVECNPTTGRITHLFLNFTYAGAYDDYIYTESNTKKRVLRYLNASLFLPFQELQCLSLSGNSITGCVTNQGFGSLSSKLEILDLRNNLFNDSILTSISELSSLKSLNLAENLFTGTNPTDELSNLRNLKELHVGENEIESLGSRFHGNSSGFINSSLSTEGLSRLNELEVLDLSGNLFNNSIFASLAGFSKLKSLNLNYNKLKGSIHMKEFCSLINLKKLFLGGNEIESLEPLFQEQLRLTKLEELGLNGNLLDNSIFSSLSALPNLKFLDLGYNRLGGPINIKELDGLSNLEELHIGCHSGCSLPQQLLSSFSSLKALSLSGLTTMAFRSHNNFCESTNLQEFIVSGNDLRGSLPMCFSNLAFLETLDLSRNEFSGHISALQGLASLQWLDLSNNEFRIPSSLGPLFNLSELKYIRADNNIIYAADEMHSPAPTFQLVYISLSCCGRGGTFPQFLYHQHDLRSVTLSDIYFKLNQFPFWLLENNTKLESLHLVNCSLSGPFQLPFPRHLVLSDLDVSTNFFIGRIPIQIRAHLPSLKTLNMSKNYFNSSIPSSFGGMSSLLSLDLSNNQLTGGVPEHLAAGCSSLEFLALSNNTLQGAIFSGNFSLMSLSVLKLDGNNFSGMIPNVYFVRIDVSRNQLSGRIPQWMGNNSSLEQIAMADNHLEGSIPRAFCNLNLQLQFLDLSMNISGTLPSCFKPSRIKEVHLFKNMLQGPLPNAFRDCSLLVTLDLSYNHFGGNIPNWIGNLSELSYLLLKRNHFEGEIPIQLCMLAHLSMIDLSQNNLSGSIPSCLKVTPLDFGPDDYSWISYNYFGSNSSISMEEPIEYTIKSRSYTYKKKRFNTCLELISPATS